MQKKLSKKEMEQQIKEREMIREQLEDKMHTEFRAVEMLLNNITGKVTKEGDMSLVGLSEEDADKVYNIVYAQEFEVEGGFELVIIKPQTNEVATIFLSETDYFEGKDFNIKNSTFKKIDSKQIEMIQNNATISEFEFKTILSFIKLKEVNEITVSFIYLLMQQNEKALDIVKNEEVFKICNFIDKFVIETISKDLENVNTMQLIHKILINGAEYNDTQNLKKTTYKNHQIEKIDNGFEIIFNDNSILCTISEDFKVNYKRL